MYIRPKRNKSGSTSIQVISKARGRYKVVKTVGCATTQQEIEHLESIARAEIEKLTCQPKLFVFETDAAIEQAFSLLGNSSIRTVGPELIFGRIYDYIGFSSIKEDLFRHLVVSRLAFPLSKLKTCDYLYRYQRVNLDLDAVYRFLDKLNDKLKQQVEQIAFSHTKKILGGSVSVVFYDMTTLYFEASDEDDLRRTGFSKDGKHQCPQIYIGLLVGLGGYAIGYDIFEGNTYEGHTLIPFLEQMSAKFNLSKPVVIADAGLLSKDNIKALEERDYQYIIGAKIKSETAAIKEQIFSIEYTDGVIKSFKKNDNTRLIISYIDKRAHKDSYNRKRGLERLEKQIRTNRLTKANINNRGFNKYLEMEGDVNIKIDYQKYTDDAIWDGLKGYITNTKLDDKSVIESYKNLWYIEKAFRMSKTDLRIRPIYHRLRRRIEAHICISFTAYCIYKELERVLYAEKSTLSLKKAAEITHNMYEINYILPESKHAKKRLLKMDKEQEELFQIIANNY